MADKCGSDDVANCIKQKAYELWKKEGCKPGHDLDYWLKAEKLVKSKKTKNWYRAKRQNSSAQNPAKCPRKSLTGYC